LEKGVFCCIYNKRPMIIAFIIMLVSAVFFFILAAVSSRFIKTKDEISQDEPFEFTEINLSTPTPTPDYKKKKSSRKPKTTK
jgi:hypothetical protein